MDNSQHSTSQHAQHEPDVLPFEFTSRPHTHEQGILGHAPQRAQQQQQQHLNCTPVAAQHAQHDSDALLLEHSSDWVESEGIYSPDAQHAQQQQHPQQQQYSEGMVWQQQQQELVEHQACAGCDMHALQLAGGSEEGQAVAARPAGFPPLGPQGRQGAQQGLGREEWQTQGGLEGPGGQQDFGMEERRKQHQLVPVLPRQQPSDMYHIEPLPGTAQAGNTCYAIVKAPR